jgi:hypothetical protein
MWLTGTEKFFFVSGNMGIFQFLRSGKFVREIGKLGRGPGEYPSLTDFAVDEPNQRIYILPNYIRQIMVFDFNGNHLNNIRLNSDTHNDAIDILDKGLIVLQSGMNITSLMSTEIVNEQGYSILQFNSRIYHEIRSLNGKAPNITYWFNNNYFVKELRNDTIYKITSKALIPYCVFNMGKFKPPIILPLEETGKYIDIYRIFESDDFIFTFFTFKGTVRVAQYNKATAEVFVSLQVDKEKTGIKNDFDNGPNFYMTIIPYDIKSGKKEWLLPLSSNSIYELKNDTKIIGNFKTLVDQFNINDNPVIMVIKLK